MVEVALSVGSVPAEWYEDDRYLVTLLDVMQTRAESAKKRRR